MQKRKWFEWQGVRERKMSILGRIQEFFVFVKGERQSSW